MSRAPDFAPFESALLDWADAIALEELKLEPAEVLRDALTEEGARAVLEGVTG